MNNNLRLLDAIRIDPGLDDDELSSLTGIRPRQQVNQLARRLAQEGLIRRIPGRWGKVVNVAVEGPRSDDTASEPAVRGVRRPNEICRSPRVEASLPPAEEVSQLVQQLAGFSFQFVCLIEPKRDQGGQIVLDFPELRYTKRKTSCPHAHGAGPFCKFKIPYEPWGSGVYALEVEGGIMYVGRAVDLAERFNMGYGQIAPRNCYKRGQSTNCRINKLVLEQALAGRRVRL